MLNFKDWEKVSEDKKTTTLKHKKGHTMTLAHSKLPKIQQEALKRLKMADGGAIDPVKAQSAQDSMRKAFHFEEGGNVPEKSPVVVNVGTPQMPAPAQSAEPVPVQSPVVPQTPNVLLPNGSMSGPGVAQTGQEALKLQSEVQKAQAAASVPQEQQYLNQTGNLNQYDAATINNLAQKAKDLDDYQKQNPLKENAYLENMGAGRKMATAIGLILSGAGTGITGGADPALEFLNKQIDRNIDAQKARFGQHSTIFSAYKDLYGNEQAASNMARVHALDFLNHQAALTAAQLGTPQAKAKYLEFSSKLGAERNKLILDSAGNLRNIPNNPTSGSGAQSSPSPSIQPQQGQSPEPQAQQSASSGEGLLSKFINGRLGSSGPSTANIPKNEQSEKPVIYPVLSPDAEYKLNGDVQYGAPRAREDYPAVSQQFTAAQQLEKVLNGPKGDGVNGIHEIFQKLYQSSGEGSVAGLGGAIQRLAHVDIMGNRIKVPALTDSQKYYEVQQNKLKTDLGAALHGIVSVADIDDMVSKYSPGFKDTPDLVREKEAGFVNSLKNALQTSQLGRYKMLAK